MKKTATLNLRVSAEFKARLALEAAKQRRSITNYLEVVLGDLWDRNSRRVGESATKKSSSR